MKKENVQNKCIFTSGWISFCCMLNEWKWNETEQEIETFKDWLNTDPWQISYFYVIIRVFIEMRKAGLASATGAESELSGLSVRV